MKKIVKRVITIGLAVFVLLAGVLVLHIYIVTRPKAPSPTTRIMARMDLKSSITSNDSIAITAWLYGQKGIDHVLCNPATRIVVFTYYPVKTQATSIVTAFNKNFTYNAVRNMPTEAEMSQGCPVASTSVIYKIGTFFKKHF
ncbi:MAG TPA: hypothetical protein VHB48_10155 [Chitinophagaceae bacterium]|jgi:hypothetical protein|nr:hypothetical protein [Chitinophagaceae bacterium]